MTGFTIRLFTLYMHLLQAYILVYIYIYIYITIIQLINAYTVKSISNYRIIIVQA